LRGALFAALARPLPFDALAAPLDALVFPLDALLAPLPAAFLAEGLRVSRLLRSSSVRSTTLLAEGTSSGSIGVIVSVSPALTRCAARAWIACVNLSS
jgi:hypothetical protein